MFVSSKTILAATLLVAASLAAPQARADIYCVDTVAKLLFALDDAGSNGVPDRILFTGGPFLAPPDGFRYASSSPSSLTLEGGYGPQCVGPGPKTVIDGSATAGSYAFSLQVENSDLAISNLAFTGFDENVSYQAGALGIGARVANVKLEGNMFFGNRSQRVSALYISGFGGNLRLLDNVFMGNEAQENVVEIGGVAVQSLLQDTCEVVNNTFISNVSSANGSFHVVNCSESVIANNIFWGNDGIDLRITAPPDQFYQLSNNDIAELLTSPQLLYLNSDNISIDPKFESGLFNFKLSFESPLVDRGSLEDFGNPDDYFGNARRSGSAPDIGAVERQTDILRDGFED